MDSLPAQNGECTPPNSPLSSTTAYSSFGTEKQTSNEDADTDNDVGQDSPAQDSSPIAENMSRKAVHSFLRSIRGGRAFFNRRSRAEDEEQTPPSSPIVRSLDKFEDGYPNLAAFSDSSENFMIYRRFGYLQSRLLLDRQDELLLLEEELDVFDRDHEAQLTSKRVLHGEDAVLRKALLERIETALTSYTGLVAAAHRMVSLYKPGESEYKSVSNYLDNEKPIHRKERSYIRHREDLITLRPGREHAWLDRTIESALNRLHKPLPFLNRLFSSETTRMKSRGGNEVYYSPERINMCASFIITMMILALLIVPIYLLFRQASSSEDPFDSHTTALCIGILLVSTLAFSAVLSLFTRAKRHEILGAAAAYCAVLVVFLGNVN